MVYCSVKGCYSSNEDGSNRIFFKFPSLKTDNERNKQWQDFCQDYAKKSFRSSHICDLHFLESDFLDSQQLVLKDNAVPTKSGSKHTKSVSQTNCSNVNDDPECLATVISKSSEDNFERFKSNISIIHNYCSTPKTETDKNLNMHVKSTTKPYNEILKKNSQVLPVKLNSVIKRKSYANVEKNPFKIFKSVQNGVEVKFYPEVVVSEKPSNNWIDCEDSSKCSWKKRIFIEDCPKLKNVEISFKSTIDFETDDEVYTRNLLGLDGLNTGTGYQTENLFDNGNLSPIPSYPSYRLKKLKQNSSQSNLVPLPKSLQKQLDNLDTTNKKQLPHYENKTLNNKSNQNNQDFSDTDYSFTSIAESVGTLNSFVEDPVKNIKLDAGEWCKLYEPSKTKFSKLSEAQIGVIVNQLRSKVSSLNDRDKLEVMFLLSMMSVYPNAPKHIKKILSQRLTLVYIATMFKWDTAISLGLNFKSKQSKGLKTNHRKISAISNNKMFYTPNVTSSLNSSVQSVQNYCSDTNDTSDINSENVSKLEERPKFAFEIIVEEKCDKTKESDTLKSSKEL